MSHVTFLYTNHFTNTSDLIRGIFIDLEQVRGIKALVLLSRPMVLTVFSRYFSS